MSRYSGEDTSSVDDHSSVARFVDLRCTQVPSFEWEEEREVPTAPQDLANETGYLRDRIAILGNEVGDSHRQALEAALTQRTAKRVKHPTVDLLRQLSAERGFSWSTIARLLNVSVPALRKWRNGGSPSPEHHLALARLCAFCEQLTQYAIADVAMWMDTPLLNDRYVTPRHLYLLNSELAPILLLEYAGEQCRPEQLLAVMAPDWQDRFPCRTHQVHEGDDGVPYIARRD